MQPASAPFGVDVGVAEFDEAAAAAATDLDTTGGKWRFVWWITIPTSADIHRFTALSRANERLTTIKRNTELECRLQKASPAHTLLLIGYVDAQRGGAFSGGFSEGFA